jgi:hypothetical protein
MPRDMVLVEIDETRDRGERACSACAVHQRRMGDENGLTIAHMGAINRWLGSGWGEMPFSAHQISDSPHPPEGRRTVSRIIVRG